MTLQLTLQRKLYALAALSLAFLSIVGGAGFIAVTSLADAATALQGDGQAMRLQMEADMAHDALRADVLAAVLASQQVDTAKEKEVRDDLAKHADGFRE